MKSVTLLYHDVVHSGAFESSGFPGGDASIYKLERSEFERHLCAIRGASSHVILTFDDGGISCYDTIAPALEDQGLQGQFFIATNWIGKPGFLNSAQIRELRLRGHRIGTHSCSHPPRMSRCAFEEIIDEWSGSRIVLSEILGESVEIGSVPGGYYSSKVGSAAAVAGLRTLFTSEPILKTHAVDGCVIAGRFTIRQRTSANTAAALARGALLPRLKQYACWNTKKVLKIAGGAAWLKLRKRILRPRRSS